MLQKKKIQKEMRGREVWSYLSNHILYLGNSYINFILKLNMQKLCLHAFFYIISLILYLSYCLLFYLGLMAFIFR